MNFHQIDTSSTEQSFSLSLTNLTNAVVHRNLNLVGCHGYHSVILEMQIEIVQPVNLGERDRLCELERLGGASDRK